MILTFLSLFPVGFWKGLYIRLSLKSKSLFFLEI